MKARLSRRDFLVRSAATGAAMGAFSRGPSVFAAPPDSPGSRIGLGIIGAGARVHSSLLPAVLSIPGVEVVGVSDAYKGRVTRTQQRTSGRAKEYGDWRALLADPAIDAVIVGTPDHWHREHVVEALAAGKDVYVEKPMTWRIEDGARDDRGGPEGEAHPAGGQPGHQLEDAGDGPRMDPRRAAGQGHPGARGLQPQHAERGLALSRSRPTPSRRPST